MDKRSMLTQQMLLALKQSAGVAPVLHASLASHTHFKIGGPCWALFAPTSVSATEAFLRSAFEQNVPVIVLGGGTNVLVSDAGIPGVVLKMSCRGIQISDDGLVMAEAGALSSALARKTADAGWSGFEWAITLPGTIGGAVRGNAGCFGGETKDLFVSALIFDTKQGIMRTVKKEEMDFGYRESVLKRKPWIVLSAQFQLSRAPLAETARRLQEALEKRLASQPKNERCAGCAFKNMEGVSDEAFTRLEKRLPNIPIAFREAHRVSAGWLVDQLELKGTRVGDAMISQVHGNFLVNAGQATADEVAQLLALVRTRVRNETGLDLHEEIQLLGFGDTPHEE